MSFGFFSYVECFRVYFSETGVGRETLALFAGLSPDFRKKNNV